MQLDDEFTIDDIGARLLVPNNQRARCGRLDDINPRQRSRDG